MKPTCLVLAGILVLATGPSLRAQFVSNADRFQLGLRLRAFEAALDQQTDEAVRKRAVGGLKPLTFTFFSGRGGEAGRLLDTARRALASPRGEAEPAVVWAEALAVRPAAVLVDRDARSVAFKLAPFYEVKGDRPGGAAVQMSVRAADGKVLAGPAGQGIAAASVEGKLPLQDLPEGDHRLRVEIVAAGKVLASWEQTFSVAARLEERVKKLQEGVKGLDEKTRDTDRDSLRNLTTILANLQRGEPQETAYPAARLLKEAEGVLAAVGAGEKYYGQKRVGQFWLRLPGPGGSTAVRLQAPEAARKGEPLPLVIALHGAGGSENLFFEGHGNGLVARLCAGRGWLLVAPRDGLPGNLVDEVHRLYPVDRRRVFLVGHSLGAAHAVAAAGQKPVALAAVAALGGGGRAQPSDALKDLPFFVGCGTEDFAISGARSLRDALRKAGVKKLRYHEYEGMEHLVVVQLALPEVFALFDEAARRP